MARIINPAIANERARSVGRDDLSSGEVIGSRQSLLRSKLGLLEDVRHFGAQRNRSPEAWCGVYQICLPYSGLFVWHVGGEDVVGDPNIMVFVRGGESYRLSAPVPQGYGELIITPDLEILSEFAHTNGRRLWDHPRFRQRTAHASAHLLKWRAILLNRCSQLQKEELLLHVIRTAVGLEEPYRSTVNARTVSLVNRAREFLAANFAVHVTLGDVGSAVDASPAYLTDAFRRVTGMSLHRYITQLRLSSALSELPRCDDLTDLAMDLGFSSHSHFSAVFRRAFQCTPSEFRQAVRRGIVFIPAVEQPRSGSADKARN